MRSGQPTPDAAGVGTAMVEPWLGAGFVASVTSFENWMRSRLGDLIVESDLRAKHGRMREDAFLFLRGTCWRWAEIAGDVCPELTEGPKAASVGDAHVGNFGLWRDAEGRLVWGANDFDEAATIPYRMDLARLVTSAALARAKDGPEEKIAEAALDGYAAGLADPRPYVLEQDHAWLRDLFAATDEERVDFWTKLEGARPSPTCRLHTAMRSRRRCLRQVRLSACPVGARVSAASAAPASWH